MPIKLTMIFIFWSSIVIAQTVHDDFHDDLKNDPTWAGDTSSFTTRNGSLWSDHLVENDNFGIHTKIPQLGSFEWSFSCHLHFNTSSLNYSDFGLYSDSFFSDGLMLRIGESHDHVILYSIEDGNEIKIFSGTEKKTIDQHVRVHVLYKKGDFKIRITYGDDSEDLFSLLDSSFLAPENFTYMRIAVHQSTKSFMGKHEFEHISYGVPQKDSLPPLLSEVQIPVMNLMRLRFTEPLDSAQEILVNLESSEGLGQFLQSEFSEPGSIVVRPKLDNNMLYDLRIRNVCDEQGNCMDTSFKILPLFHEEPVFGDVIISEIMADPEPVVGLPPFEYIELFNRSEKVVDISNFQLRKKNDQTRLPKYFLLPGTRTVLADADHIGVDTSIPFLYVPDMFNINNSKDWLVLETISGTLLHEVNYSVDWIQDQAKKAGGWSAEMCDPEKFCTTTGNWAASVSPQGGSPGKVNSRHCMIHDQLVPRLTSTGIPEKNQWILEFDEVIHPGSAVSLSGLDESPVLESFKTEGNIVYLNVRPLELSSIQSFILSGHEDCYGNRHMAGDTFQLGEVSHLEQGLIQINEVLFNANLSAEYIEIKNCSEHIVDLQELRLRIKSTSGFWSKSYSLVERSHILLPGHIACFSKDTGRVARHFYRSVNTSRLYSAPTMPALHNKDASLGLVNPSLDWIDTIHYSESFHHPLLDKVSDVSLERDVDGKNGWVSSSSASGFGTPGAENSCIEFTTRYSGVHKNSGIQISSDPFYPKDNGRNERLRIEFECNGAFTYSLSIYHVNGTLAVNLVEQGFGVDRFSFTWDGTNQVAGSLPQGIYLVSVEYQTDDMKRGRAVKCVTLAHRE